MQYATNSNGERIEALPKARAICPACKMAVLAKCGQINIWHWAHINADCDPWSESEGDWHRWWKSLVLPEQREVVIGNHRADVVHKNGTVIELQHSPISPETIAERETHYKNMIWLFDYSGSIEILQVKETELSFRWKNAKKAIGLCTKPVFVDMRSVLRSDIIGPILRIDNMSCDAPNIGRGRFIHPSDFIDWLRGGEVSLEKAHRAFMLDTYSARTRAEWEGRSQSMIDDSIWLECLMTEGYAEVNYARNISPFVPPKPTNVAPIRPVFVSVAERRIKNFFAMERQLVKLGMMKPITIAGWHAIKCPWQNEHIGKTGSASVIEPGAKNAFRGGFYCRHCFTKRGMRDLEDWVHELSLAAAE